METWLPIGGYEGVYEVSDRGRVYVHDRWCNGRNGPHLRRGRIMRQSRVGSSGMPYLAVNLSRDGRKQRHMVHRLVLEAFAGPCPEGHESLHGPGGLQDNRWPENLRWGTRVENQADRVRDGTDLRGVQLPQSRLTEDIVREIRARHAAGERQGAVAADLGLPKQTVQNVTSRRTWRHVT